MVTDVSEFVSGMRSLYTKVDHIDKKLEKGFQMVLKKQINLLHKLLDTEEIILQDEERTCPKYIHLGNKTLV